MTTELEKIQADMEFYAQVGPLMVELEEARLVKKEDPARWRAAVEALDGDDGNGNVGARTYWRHIGEAVRAFALAATDDSGDVSIGLGSVEATAAPITPAPTEAS